MATEECPVDKPLKWLVTACCQCQKIQTGDGHWCDGEDLLQQVLHKGLVTHSVCPDCVRVLYPEIADHVLKKYAVAAS